MIKQLAIEEQIYIVDDGHGSTEQIKSEQVGDYLMRNPRWKIHVYRRYRTIGDLS